MARKRKPEHRAGLTYAAYVVQRNSAHRRGIDFNFTYEEWLAWWNQALAAIGPEAKRGLRRGEYMMCRFGDIGVYESGNVYAGTSAQNQGDVDPEKRRAALQAAWEARRESDEPCWLEGKRGDAHPKSKPIMTPKGRFGSANLAAEAFGITRQAVHYKVKDESKPDWYFEISQTHNSI